MYFSRDWYFFWRINSIARKDIFFKKNVKWHHLPLFTCITNLLDVYMRRFKTRCIHYFFNFWLIICTCLLHHLPFPFIREIPEAKGFVQNDNVGHSFKFLMGLTIIKSWLTGCYIVIKIVNYIYTHILNNKFFDWNLKFFFACKQGHMHVSKLIRIIKKILKKKM